MSPELINLIIQATFESLYMVGIAALLGTAFGLPLGVFLATSRKGELFAAPLVNRVLGIVVNATRSTPFIILVVAIIPFTRLIAGTSIGARASAQVGYPPARSPSPCRSNRGSATRCACGSISKVK